jgi:hypothetical protein
MVPQLHCRHKLCHVVHHEIPLGRVQAARIADGHCQCTIFKMQDILLWSHSLSVAQKTARLLDHPGLGSNKPSAPMDQLITVRTVYNLTQQCMEVWENRGQTASLCPPPLLYNGPSHCPTATAAALHLSRLSKVPDQGKKSTLA